EASGTLYDSSGKGNNGTQSGGVTYGATGKVGNALSFDGVDDYINCGNNSFYNFGTGGFTVGGWAYVKGEPSNYGAALIDKGTGDFTDASSNQKGFWLSIARNSNPVRDMNWAVGNGSGYNAKSYSISNLNLQNIWHYIVGVADNQSVSGPKLKIYVDGVLVGTVDRTYTGSIDATSSNLCIGKSCALNRFLNAIIDDIRIYNRALSAAEVQALYAATNK
ncbi:MAG: LamG domain-containing protein, partial [Candidatus Paceibacterota bacterium]